MVRLPWHFSVSAIFTHALLLPSSRARPSGNGQDDSAVAGGLKASQETSHNWNLSDLSSITRLAAIGDSYSAGIGAGKRLGDVLDTEKDSDYACSRYDHAYPYLLNHDERLGNSTGRNFEFVSCSGATADDVIQHQLPSITADQQVILLSAGSYDVQLTNILNQCIFQFAAVNSDKVDAAKTAAFGKGYPWANKFDWETLSRSCESQLQISKELVHASSFDKNLDLLLEGAKEKLAPGGMIYFTGYAKFWAEDLQDSCNEVSWSVWGHTISNTFQAPQNLTSNHRGFMNDIINALNSKISAAVVKAGPSVRFVDVDRHVGDWEGRFCENGVNEASTGDKSRLGLMLYGFNTFDVLGNEPPEPSLVDTSSETFEATLERFAQIANLLDSKSHLAQEMTVQGRADNGTTTSPALGLLPARYKRVFHPQPLLHSVIASLIIYDMSRNTIQPDVAPGKHLKARDEECPNLGTVGQQVAIASYINPLADPAAWNRLIGYPTDKLSILVANVVNGPDNVVDNSWKDVIDRAAATGKTVLGYVRTGYLGVSEQKFKTRLGSTILSDWVAQIEQDVDMWYKLYGKSIGGIFFDEGWNNCGPNNEYSDLYKYINDYTKRKYNNPVTVLNPGATMPQCFEHTMDTLMTYEMSYDTYVNNYIPNPWTSAEPRKLWHIIYNVPEAEVERVANLALERGAGLVEITNDIMPNPYDNLPAESYMQKQLGAVSGGTPLNSPPSPFPEGLPPGSVNPLQVVFYDYTSVHLSWRATADAIGYNVYNNGVIIASVPESMTEIVVGGFSPGQRLKLTVAGVGGEGMLGPASSAVSVTCRSLPGGSAVSDLESFVTQGQTEYEANIWVPYAFQRVYIWQNDNCQYERPPTGWPINYDGDKFICATYMIEGTTLYKYTGVVHEGDTNMPWAWTPMPGVVPIDTVGYHWKWTIPLGNEDMETSKFIVQAQGYGPFINSWFKKPKFG